LCTSAIVTLGRHHQQIGPLGEHARRGPLGNGANRTLASAAMLLMGGEVMRDLFFGNARIELFADLRGDLAEELPADLQGDLVRVVEG